MALGADLVADDAVEMRLLADDVILACPDSIKGMVEARGVGILTVKSVDATKLAFVVDLDKPAPTRLPEAQKAQIQGRLFPLICGKGNQNLGAVVWCLLGGGRILPTQ
jgi:HPr kinase/phosphorylase